MIEHRLIERMITLIGAELARIGATGEADAEFIDTATDFIRVYADRTHHGKEEDILFHELEARALRDEHRRLMDELVQEHVYGRKTTRALMRANRRYARGETEALGEVREVLEALTTFYPRHIEKEDKVFFPAAMDYLTDEEQQAMLEDFRDFDAGMIHERYRRVVEQLEPEAKEKE
jgi:hemerythrin-like domain-containing protein